MSLDIFSKQFCKIIKNMLYSPLEVIQHLLFLMWTYNKCEKNTSNYFKAWLVNFRFDCDILHIKGHIEASLSLSELINQ